MTGATNVTDMFGGCDINETGTTTNYDNTLTSWAAQDLNTGLTTSFGSSQYSVTGATGKTIIETDYLWTIADGDAIFPELDSLVINTSGDTLTLTYDRALDESVTGSTTDFTLSGTSVGINTILVTGSTVELGLDGTVLSSETGIVLTYTGITSPIKDTTGSEAATFTDEPVTNNSEAT